MSGAAPVYRFIRVDVDPVSPRGPPPDTEERDEIIALSDDEDEWGADRERQRMEAGRDSGQPPEKRMKEEEEEGPISFSRAPSSASSFPSAEVLDLRQKLMEMECNYNNALTALSLAEGRTDHPMSGHGSQDGFLDDSNEEMGMQQRLDELSAQLKGARRLREQETMRADQSTNENELLKRKVAGLKEDLKDKSLLNEDLIFDLDEAHNENDIARSENGDLRRKTFVLEWKLGKATRKKKRARRQKDGLVVKNLMLTMELEEERKKAEAGKIREDELARSNAKAREIMKELENCIHLLMAERQR